LSVYGALLSVYGALLSVYGALLSVYGALLRVYGTCPVCATNVCNTSHFSIAHDSCDFGCDWMRLD